MRIYLVLVQTEAGAIPLHAFGSPEAAARFINQKRSALDALGGGCFRMTDMLVNGLPTVSLEPVPSDGVYKEGLEPGWTEKPFGHGRYATHTYAEMMEGSEGGGREALLRWAVNRATTVAEANRLAQCLKAYGD
jgi:hypothetical protein